VKADRSPARPLSRPARAGLVLIILAAGGYALAKYNGLLPWDAPKAAQAAPAPAAPSDDAQGEDRKRAAIESALARARARRNAPRP